MLESDLWSRLGLPYRNWAAFEQQAQRVERELARIEGERSGLRHPTLQGIKLFGAIFLELGVLLLAPPVTILNLTLNVVSIAFLVWAAIDQADYEVQLERDEAAERELRVRADVMAQIRELHEPGQSQALPLPPPGIEGPMPWIAPARDRETDT